MKACRPIAVILLLATVASCSSLHPPPCQPGQQPAVQELVYFGAQTPSGPVAPADWADFLAMTVTPRFPEGLTTWQASGQWRSGSGELVREPSHVLSVVHPANAASEAAIGDIVEAYKRRFRQEAVLRVRSGACISL
jgi:hypothetical protein